MTWTYPTIQEVEQVLNTDPEAATVKQLLEQVFGDDSKSRNDWLFRWVRSGDTPMAAAEEIRNRSFRIVEIRLRAEFGLT